MSSATLPSSTGETESPRPADPPLSRESHSSTPIVEELGSGLFFVCQSQAMREIRSMVDLVAQTNLPVLILGETGTGKEVIVRLIHCLSLRRNRPLFKVNCAALPAELLESELFGYEAGAFTGANKPNSGKFDYTVNGITQSKQILRQDFAAPPTVCH